MTARYTYWLPCATVLLGFAISGCTDGHKTPSSNGEALVSKLPPESESQPSGLAADGNEESPSSDAPIDSIRQVPVVGRRKDDEVKLNELLDPASTGWTSEAFNDAAGKRLKLLAKCIESSKVQTQTDFGTLIVEGFQCASLVPETDEAFRDQKIIVRRQRDLSVANPAGCSVKEFSGYIKQLRQLGRHASVSKPVDPSEDYHVKFKIVGVELDKSSARTEVYAEGAGRFGAKSLQWRANWSIAWSLQRDGAHKIQSIVVDGYEQTILAGGRWLVDCTEGVLGTQSAFRDQLRYGMDHWIRRIPSSMRINRLGHNGIALGDVNGDGRHDLYVCQSGGLPNRLFIASPDGSANDESRAAGVDFLDDSTCALLVDLDNDGDEDLAIVTIGGGLLLENDGHGKFRVRTTLLNCGNAFSLTAVDYDLDGRLDLYAARYWPSAEDRGDIPLPVPYFDATNGGGNLLFHNDGEWKFRDVTEEVGLDVDNTRFSMAAAWDDFDNDGDDDLYVANDFGRNCLYRNDAGKFTNIARQAGVEDAASGMSVTFGDYDHDGDSDIYISNMFSSAGSRITYQRHYQDRFGTDGTKAMQHMARGNTLFRNGGDGTFTDVSQSSEVTMGRWAWGSMFSDVNNDSLDDLLVLNGNISTDDTGDL